jgi:hypothetical protein
MRRKGRNEPRNEQDSRNQQQVTGQNNKVDIKHGHVQGTPTACKHLRDRQYQEGNGSYEEQN